MSGVRICGCELRSGIRHIYGSGDAAAAKIREVVEIERIQDPVRQLVEHMQFEETNILPWIPEMHRRKILADHREFRRYTTRGQLPPTAELVEHSNYEKAHF